MSNKTVKMKKPSVKADPLKKEENLVDAEKDGSVFAFQYDALTVAMWALKALLWCLLMILFITLEFGAVFFVFSVFYLMFTNFRKSSRPPGELSAYSVFNPNCESIDGTLTAQQFEKELMFGATAVH